jgi:adenosylcobinamide kinase/adenosylcobinamide-phosphate guanylyltransferase
LSKLTLILGGARSGKSRHAENLAMKNGGRVVFIATAQPLDDEMEARIQHHREARLTSWSTLELPVGVGLTVMSNPPEVDLILLDCLTLLVSNAMLLVTGPDGRIDEQTATNLVEGEITDLIKAITAAQTDWIVVSNEVGMGLVPPYPLGRLYRDLLGRANQRLAAQADQVVFMIAGIPMTLKAVL